MRAALRAAAAALAATLALAASDVAAQDAGWRDSADVVARYKIDAELREAGLEESYHLSGEETILWRNTSREPVKSLYFHCYPNAFRNTRSTFLREASRDPGFELRDDTRFGGMTLRRVSVLEDELAVKWVAPDDGNPDDRTVARVELSHEVEPSVEVAIRVSFTVDFPTTIRRMGGQHGFVMGAQWYPKLGRFVGRDAAPATDGWYCPQYHANCEFSADFADYEVTLKVPSEFKVGASGVPVRDAVADEKTGVTTHVHKAASVVDFAWAAGKRVLVQNQAATETLSAGLRPIEREITPVVPEDDKDPVSAEWRRVRTLLDVPPQDFVLPKVTVVLLLQPEHEDQAQRHFEAARVALGLFGTWLGPYPYPRLTIVDPPWHARVGGMEYPTLVTAGTAVDSPADSLRPEHVIVHEIGHQWLMNLLASDECAEAWLDEGVNTYLTAQAMAIAYGRLEFGHVEGARQYTTLFGRHVPLVPFFDFPGVTKGWPEFLGLPKWARPADIEILRVWRDLPSLTWVPSTAWRDDPMLVNHRGLLRSTGWDAMVKEGWKYADRTSYRVNAYDRPALFLNTLRRSLVAKLGRDEGERRFLRALREYAREQRFRHPTTQDFFRTFRDVTQTEPALVAEALVATPGRLDYAIESMRPDDDPPLRGLDDDGQKAKPPRKEDEKPAAEKQKRTVVRVRRLGDVVVEMPLEVTREDGTRETRKWTVTEQAKDAWRDFVFDGKVAVARLDPERVYLQDVDLGNNARAKETNARPAVKWSVRFLGWLENALVGYGRFF